MTTAQAIRVADIPMPPCPQCEVPATAFIPLMDSKSKDALLTGIRFRHPDHEGNEHIWTDRSYAGVSVQRTNGGISWESLNLPAETIAQSSEKPATSREESWPPAGHEQHNVWPLPSGGWSCYTCKPTKTGKPKYHLCWACRVRLRWEVNEFRCPKCGRTFEAHKTIHEPVPSPVDKLSTETPRKTYIVGTGGTLTVQLDVNLLALSRRERVVLGNLLDLLDDLERGPAIPAQPQHHATPDTQAVGALVSMGTKPREAQRMVALAQSHLGPGATSEALIREVFKGDLP